VHRALIWCIAFVSDTRLGWTPVCETIVVAESSVLTRWSYAVTDGDAIHSSMAFLTKRVSSWHILSQSRQGRPDYEPVFVYFVDIIQSKTHYIISLQEITYTCGGKGESKSPSCWWSNERISKGSGLKIICSQFQMVLFCHTL
jgi:hypothetical protein